MARPLQGMEVNVIGTRNIIQAASQLGSTLQRLVLAQFCSVRTARNLPGETVIPTSLTYLPISTDFGRFVMKEWDKRFIVKGFRLYTLIHLLRSWRDLGMTSAPTAMLNVLRRAAIQDAHQRGTFPLCRRCRSWFC